MKTSQQNIEDIIFQEDDKNKNNMSDLFTLQSEPKSSSPKDKNPSPEQGPNSLFPFFLELIDRMSGSLAAMKTLAFYSRENFRDRDLGDYFYQVVSEDIEKSISVLDCFCDYLNLNNPIKKMNTINVTLEEILKENQRELENKNIRFIKKKFTPDLPETTLTDEQLRFILNSIFQYILFSIPLNGGMGIVTRSIEAQEWSGEEKTSLQKNFKYIEILFVSTHLDSNVQSVGSIPFLPSEGQEQKMDLILQMVKKTLEKNGGTMDTKSYVEKRMNLISLVFPIERRNVFQFLLPQDRLKKTEKRD
jgi:hypothetical protein